MGDERTTALSIEQVNDNADELVELRGQGRYFGVPGSGADEQTGPRCHNCNQRGHLAASCKAVVCHSCGVVDDHYTQQCPKSVVCANCGEKGHFRSNCDRKLKKLYCQLCASTAHSSDRCTSIWRSYLTKEDARTRIGIPSNVYCYNCGEKGHYGDDCPLQRASRMPNQDGSAFSGYNLPKGVVDEYYRMVRKRKSGRDQPQGPSQGPSQGHRGFLGKIKDKLRRGSPSGGSRGDSRGSRGDSRGSTGPGRIDKTRSLPNLKARHGVLPLPTGPRNNTHSVYEFPRNSQSGYNSYNNSYNSSYNNNNYNNNYKSKSRSGFLPRR